MRVTFRTALAALVAISCAGSPASATSRIKDLASIEGVRQNQLIGYGLVVGLNGTGDTLNNSPFTKQSLQAMLERLGVNIRGQQIRTGNVAAVMVTADLPPFAKSGQTIDITVASIANANLNTVEAFLEHPQLHARDRVRKVNSPNGPLMSFLPALTIPGVMPVMGDIPAVGAHTEAILTELGLAEPDLKETIQT